MSVCECDGIGTREAFSRQVTAIPHRQLATRTESRQIPQIERFGLSLGSERCRAWSRQISGPLDTHTSSRGRFMPEAAPAGASSALNPLHPSRSMWPAARRWSDDPQERRTDILLSDDSTTTSAGA